MQMHKIQMFSVIFCEMFCKKYAIRTINRAKSKLCILHMTNPDAMICLRFQ